MKSVLNKRGLVQKTRPITSGRREDAYKGGGGGNNRNNKVGLENSKLRKNQVILTQIYSKVNFLNRNDKEEQSQLARR